MISLARCGAARSLAAMRRPPLHILALAIGAGIALPAGAEDGKASRIPGAPRLRVLTLEQAYDLALASDQAIRNAAIEVRSANLEPWSALTRIGPRLTGHLSYELIHEKRFMREQAVTPLDETLAAPDIPPFTNPAQPGQLTPPGVSGPTADPVQGAVGAASPLGVSDFDGTHSYTRRAGVTLEQPLLDLTVFPAWRFGKLSSASARLRRQFIIRETLFGVARAYYAVLKTEAIVAVNRQTVSLGQDQVEVARHRFSSGDVLRTDVLRAEAVVHAARRTLIESEGLLELHRDTLVNILNLDWDVRFTIVDPNEAVPAADSFGEILQNAFVRREDFRVSSLGIGQRVERRKEIAASYAPRIVAQANHDWTNVTTNTSNTDGQRIWSGLIAVQVPFFTGGQREIDLRKAGHAIEEARLDHETLTKAIEAEVRRAWIDVRTLRESIAALEAEALVTEKTFEDLRNNYQFGNATSVDVSAGLRDQNNARASLAGIRYDYQVALRNLQRAEAAFQDQRVRNARVK
jgi:outer membrane protein TolC